MFGKNIDDYIIADLGSDAQKYIADFMNKCNSKYKNSKDIYPLDCLEVLATFLAEEIIYATCLEEEVSEKIWDDSFGRAIKFKNNRKLH